MWKFHACINNSTGLVLCRSINTISLACYNVIVINKKSLLETEITGIFQLM